MPESSASRRIVGNIMPDSEVALEACDALSASLRELSKPLTSTTPVEAIMIQVFDRDGRFWVAMSDPTFHEYWLHSEKYWGEVQSSILLSQGPGFSLSRDHPKRDEVERRFQRIIGILDAARLGHELSFNTSNTVPRRDRRTFVYFYCNRYDIGATGFYLNHTTMLRRFAHFVTLRFEEMLVELPAWIGDDKTKALIGSTFFDKDALQEAWAPTLQLEALEQSMRYRSLTKRQQQILHWFLQGKTTEEVAMILGIQPGTCRVHVSRMLKRFDCHSKLQLIGELLMEEPLHDETIHTSSEEFQADSDQ